MAITITTDTISINRVNRASGDNFDLPIPSFLQVSFPFTAAQVIVRLRLYLLRMYRFVLAVLFLYTVTAAAQPKTDSLLRQLLSAHSNPLLQQVLQQPAKYRLQIIYTQINRGRKNNPSFSNLHFHYDTELYFNPASMVKMPLVFLALEKLNLLKKEGIDKYTTVQFDSSHPWQRKLLLDTTPVNRRPTMAHLVKRAFW